MNNDQSYIVFARSHHVSIVSYHNHTSTLKFFCPRSRVDLTLITWLGIRSNPGKEFTWVAASLAVPFKKAWQECCETWILHGQMLLPL